LTYKENPKLLETSLCTSGGSIYVRLNDQNWLLDTGCPTSFGIPEFLSIEGKNFTLPDEFMGFSAKLLSKYTENTVAGIIGVDILNEFHVLMDLPSRRLLVSKQEISLEGSVMEIEEFMGVPVIQAQVAGTQGNMFFRTGAFVSYLQDEAVESFPRAGKVTDFFPGVGLFQVETYLVDAQVGKESLRLRCALVPEVLGTVLAMAGCEGIIGNEIIAGRQLGYFPLEGKLILGNDSNAFA